MTSELRQASTSLPVGTVPAATRDVEAAVREGLVDVAYARIESPLGPLVAAATPEGLVLLAYEHDRLEALLGRLAQRISPRVVDAPARLDPVRRQIDEYFARDRRRFDLPLDWCLTAGFTRRVLQAAATIPYGSVRSYREVAAAAGSPRGSRPTGRALGANPLAVVVPCHRVVRTDGGLGGYTTGVDKKAHLLGLEGVLAYSASGSLSLRCLSD